jgi:hypothetical protein
MKLKLYSQSGKPTDIEAADAYAQEFKEEYDKLWARKEDGELTLGDMREELEKVDKMLAEKYPMYSSVEMPRSGKQWKELIMACECPVILAVTEETKELALFKMDSEY